MFWEHNLFYIAISFKPEDKPRLTDEFMDQIAKEYMEKMDIKDTQYVIARHHNTPNPHCHLIFNRVDNNGKRISDSNWLKRNVRVCKELKQEYGLTFGEGKSQARTEKLRPYIPQGISFTRNGTTFKGSSLDRSLSFSRIDQTSQGGGKNIDTGGQSQEPSVHESRSNEQDHSLVTDLSMLAADLAIGLIASGQDKKSEEQDPAPRKKRGMRL